MPRRTPSRKAYWLKLLHQWHWISAAVSLIGMLLFAITGITLNHAGQIEAQPRVTTSTARLPEALRQEIARQPANEGDAALALPPGLRQWLAAEMPIARSALDGGSAEWSAEEIYLALPRPGGDAWLRIDRESGDVEYEQTDRGWVSYLNDLHKGRHTGTAWSWFIDLFAAACVVFTVTGLLILKLHATRRPSTWPIVALGLVVPVLLAVLFIH